MKRKKSLKEKGITLIALVITIIILLILAGIAISALTGSELFEKARLAKEKQENAEIEEDEILGDYENKISNYVSGSRDTVTISKEEYEILKNKGKYELIGEGNIETTDDTIQLNKNIDDYSYLMFRAYLNSGTNNDWVDVKIIPAELNSYVSLVLEASTAHRVVTIYTKSNNKISTNLVHSNDNLWKSTYVYVYGIF